MEEVPSRFSSTQGMQSRAWGPAFWMCLYTVAANSPPTFKPQDKQRLLRFIQSMADNLPCRYCREAFPKNSLDAGIGDAANWTTRESFFGFVYRLHNAVRLATTGKPLEFSQLEARELLEECRAGCSSTAPPAASVDDNTTTNGPLERACTPAKGGQKIQCRLEFHKS